MSHRRPKKRCAIYGQNIVPDPLVDPGDPPHRYQACTAAHPTRAHHRMVAVSEIVKWSSVMKSTLQPLHLKTLTSGSSNKPSIVRATTIGREQFGQSGEWGCIFPTDRKIGRAAGRG